MITLQIISINKFLLSYRNANYCFGKTNKGILQVNFTNYKLSYNAKYDV